MNGRRIKKSYISCTGYFFSYKNNTQIAFESTLERDFYLSLEFNSSVLSYKEQPETMKYEYPDGGKRRYTPDTLVTYLDGSEVLFEVKYKDDLESPELQHKLSVLEKHINSEYGMEFKLFTDEDIPEQYLENIRFLYKFASVPKDNHTTSLIKSIVEKRSPITIREIINLIEQNTIKQLELIPYVWNYLYLDNTLTNLEDKLTMNTVFSIESEANE